MNNYILYKGVWIAKNPFDETELSKDECHGLLKRGYLVRNTYKFDCKEKTSFWFVIKDSFGGMEELSSKKRNQVRKSLKMCDIRMVSRDVMIEQGYVVQVSAAKNYRVKTAIPSREQYVNRFSINNSEDHEYWGVFDKASGQMIAFAINRILNNICDYETMKAIPKFQKSHYPYYGLIYEMNRYYLEVRSFKFVNYGARTITNHSNIQPFLIDTFNFRKAFCHIKLTYVWWFGLVVKILYPFRKLIKNAKVQAILNMEAMARGQM